MALLTGSLAFDVIALAATVLTGIIAYFKWKLGHWERLGIETVDNSIPFGSIKDLALNKLSFGEQFRKHYFTFKSRGLIHGGVYTFTSPFYMPLDTGLIKNIITRDFAHFMNHGNFSNEKNDPLSAHLFNLEDAKWRHMRVKLTPTFTSGKMKMMFQTLADCAVGLQSVMDEAEIQKIPVDIKEVLGRFTTDIIGSCAFGFECNSLKNPQAQFRKYGRRIFEDTSLERIKNLMQFAIPNAVLRAIGFKRSKSDVEEFFMKAVKDTVDYREKNNIYRKDFMHLLLQLKNRGSVADDEKITNENGTSEEKALTLEELAAQAFVFFAAGFETSSTTMTWALFELATNPDVQSKLRKEIKQVLEKHDNKITYDGIMEMTYMDRVINETLRKYPPFPFLPRVCSKNYQIPGTDIIIKKGTRVVIPIWGLQNDPEYYPGPDKFDPDRFTEENKRSRPAFTWLPFGDGPRICIGMRFGLMQTKVGLATVLGNYKITLSKKTQLPVKMDTHSFVTSAADGIWIDVEKI